MRDLHSNKLRTLQIKSYFICIADINKSQLASLGLTVCEEEMGINNDAVVILYFL